MGLVLIDEYGHALIAVIIDREPARFTIPFQQAYQLHARPVLLSSKMTGGVASQDRKHLAQMGLHIILFGAEIASFT
jgi:hypothetical protein